MKKLIPVLLIAALIFACSSNTSEPEPTDNFDRGALLRNVADNIIIPSFQDFNNKLITFKTNAQAFTNAPSTTTLEVVRTGWFQAYKSWQNVAMFNIGKAEDFGTSDENGGFGYVSHFNIYPTDVTLVESNIANGTYNFDAIGSYDAQGFPALDYLLYGVAADDSAIVAKYTTDANAANYKDYVIDVIDKMSAITTQIINDWNSGYRDTFVNSTANTRTSSLNKFVNDFIYNYEKKFRANKFGIPVGVFSSTVLPEKVEGFYKKTSSKEFALQALTTIEKVFKGTGFNGSTGVGFKAYLQELDRADVVTEIENQFASARTQINGLNANFYQQLIDNETSVLNTYSEIQKAVVLLKVDMINAFNVSLDFTDADGD